MAILESVEHGGTGPCFPLFIDGPAGSGKSTMLQHLIRHYLAFADRRPSSGLRPLYLTWSEELLRKARRSIAGLLRNSAAAHLGGPPRPEAVEGLIAGCFWVWRDYLLSLLPDGLRAGRFRKENYVNYPVFCRLWAGKPELRRLAPDLCWHVLRTYVKGMRSDPESSAFGPGGYLKVGEKDRSATVDTYQAVYDKVWERWYRPLCEEGGRWDDQDLAAELLGPETELPAHPAIFCDEAQDFTPVELELLYQMSLFSRRRVPGHLPRRVPFAFAGDPFQTLNPTGFRWERVKSSFYKKLVESRQGAGHGDGLDLNYQPLRHNCRSTEHVVKFCNTVQLLRTALFRMGSVRPQECWWLEEHTPMPCWFDEREASVRDSIAAQADLVIVVNCDEGEEDAYVRADPFLDQAVRKDDTGVAQNVFSPVRAKGLEFQRVVLYRFGQSCPAELLRCLRGEAVPQDDPDRMLPLEYFCNRLYVAASRAKRRLFVVDTPEALGSFWQFACEPQRFWELTASVSQRDETWRDHCSFLRQGAEPDWSQDHEGPRLLAGQMEKRGLAEGVARFWRQAALIHESTGQAPAAQRCRAEALALEGELDLAGQSFQNLGITDRALECYWKGGRFGRIRHLGHAFPDIANTAEYRAAEFMTGPPEVEPAWALLDRLRVYRQGPGSGDRVVEDRVWNQVCTKIATVLAAADRGSLPAPQWQRAWQELGDLRRQGAKIEGRPLAELAYRAGQPIEALAVWEGEGLQKDRRYRQVKAEVSPYPQNLEWLALLEEWEAIRAKREAHADQALPEADLALVAQAYWKLGQRDRALATQRQAPREDLIVSWLREALESQPPTPPATLGEMLGDWLGAVVRAGRWSDALRMTQREGLEDLLRRNRFRAEDVERLLAALPRDLRPLQAALVQQCARSEQLPREPVSSQQSVSAHLRGLYTHGSGEWDGWRKLGVSLAVAGAAVERAGLINDALAFYEWVEDKSPAPADKRLAQRRRIRCLEKRADYLATQEGTQRDVERVRREVERLRQGATWLSPDQPLPEFPVLSSEPAVRPAGRSLPGGNTEWRAGGFSFRWFGAAKRLVLIDDRQGRTATYIGRTQQFNDPEEESTLTEVGGRKTWESFSWGLRVTFESQPGGGELVIELGGEVVERLLLPP